MTVVEIFILKGACH